MSDESYWDHNVKADAVRGSVDRNIETRWFKRHKKRKLKKNM